MHAEPEHRAILALDIEGFGRLERTNLDRARMRTGLHRIIRNALSAAGIDPDHIEQTEHGDGVLVLLGPQVSKARLLHPLLPRLVSAWPSTTAPQPMVPGCACGPLSMPANCSETPTASPA